MGATPTPELPVKECGTPDTIWGALVDAEYIKFTARFPVPLIAPQEAKAFAAEMHAAMLPVVERLFERRWAQMFAGKKDAEGRLYPQTYQELWPSQAGPEE
jgi:hypothetical protein